MKQGFNHITRATRGLTAVVVACFVLLQAMGLIGASMLGSSAHGSSIHVAKAGVVGVQSAALGAHCDGQGQGPAGAHRDHAQCCVLCSASDRAAAALDVALLAQIVTLLSPQDVAATIVHFTKDFSPPEAAGLASSWSATAPPRRAA